MACEATSHKSNPSFGNKRPGYWWCPEAAQADKECVVVKLRYTRLRRTLALPEHSAKAKYSAVSSDFGKESKKMNKESSTTYARRYNKMSAEIHIGPSPDDL